LNEEALVRAAGGDPRREHKWEAWEPAVGENKVPLNGDRCLVCGLEAWSMNCSDDRRTSRIDYRQPEEEEEDEGVE
jgi:hypothetical protein